MSTFPTHRHFGAPRHLLEQIAGPRSKIKSPIKWRFTLVPKIMSDKRNSIAFTLSPLIAPRLSSRSSKLSKMSQAFLSPCVLRHKPPIQGVHGIPNRRYVPKCTIDKERESAQVEADAMAAAGATLILKHAANAYINSRRRPSTVALRESMLQLEKIQRANKAKVDLNKLLGQWRLVFVTPKKSPSPFNSLYFPLCAHQTFRSFEKEAVDIEDSSDVEIGEFDNGVFLLGSALYFRVIGPMRFSHPGNRLEFSVDRLKIKVGPFEWVKDGLDKDGYTLKGRRVAKLPFFTFFCVRDDIAVARGRSGGLALYTRVAEDKQL